MLLSKATITNLDKNGPNFLNLNSKLLNYR